MAKKRQKKRKAKGLTEDAAEQFVHRWMIGEGHKRETMFRAIKTRWNREDILGCDIVSLHNEVFWFVQVTTQLGRSDRRRRLEKIGWNPTKHKNILVLLVSHEPVDNPVDRSKKMHYLKFEEYYGKKKWGRAYVVGPLDKKRIDAITIKPPEKVAESNAKRKATLAKKKKAKSAALRSQKRKKKR